MEPISLGVIFCSRGLEPNPTAEKARESVLRALKTEHIQAVLFEAQDAPASCIATSADAQRCAQWLEQHRSISGVLVSLPEAGDVTLLAEALRRLRADTPLLIHAFPDDLSRMSDGDRHDAFGEKIALCALLNSYGIRFSLTSQHTVDPESEPFKRDVRSFGGACRVVRGLAGARLGAVVDGAAHPVSEDERDMLEQAGVTVERLDLADLFSRADRIGSDDARLHEKLAAVTDYVPSRDAPEGALARIAKLGVAIDEWTSANGLQAAALPCRNLPSPVDGVLPCTVLSMMNSALLPSACDMDTAGLLGMYALVLASDKPGAVVGWGSNYGTEPDKAVVLHCSNLPREMLLGEGDSVRLSAHIDYKPGGGDYGAVVGRMRQSPMTFCRSIAGQSGQINAYLGEGLITSDPLNMSGGYGVVHIPEIQKLLHSISEGGYGRQVAICGAHVGGALQEALSRYLGWNVLYHTGIYEWFKRGDPFRERI